MINDTKWNRILSIPHISNDIITVTMETIKVVYKVSFLLGQIIFFISFFDSVMRNNIFFPVFVYKKTKNAEQIRHKLHKIWNMNLTSENKKL